MGMHLYGMFFSGFFLEEKWAKWKGSRWIYVFLAGRQWSSEVGQAMCRLSIGFDSRGELVGLFHVLYLDYWTEELKQ